MDGDSYKAKNSRRSAWHSIRDATYHVNEWGDPDNSLLVLLHGWGDAGSTFQFLVDELGSDLFIVAPDWRGFGESTQRAQSYWFPDYIADLDALLRIYSPQRPANLLGHSMGANIAALYAGVYPDRVSAMINVEGFGLADRDPEDAPANYRRWIEKEREREAYRRFDSFDDLAARIRKRSPRMPDEMARFVAEQWATTAAGGGVEIRADPAHRLPNAVLYRRAEAEACWRNVSAPVLVVIGADSEFVGGAAAWLDFGAEELPFASVSRVTIDDAGHMLHFEQPGALAEATRKFLARPG